MSYSSISESLPEADALGHRPRAGLLAEVQRRLRVNHYSLRTERAYLGWIRRFIDSNERRHPRTLGGPEVEAFLSHLAVEGQVSPSTQNQALSALLFLYRDVLAVELPWMENVVRAKRARKLPVVLSRAEVQRLLAQLEGRPWLMASLLYGSGLRLLEMLRLRVKDMDFDRAEIIVRDGKGAKDRRTMLPQALVVPLQAEVERARALHAMDLAAGSVLCGFLMPCRVSTAMRIGTLVGNSYFHLSGAVSTRVMMRRDAIMLTMPSYRAR